MSPKKIALFGGSFNPIHNHHVKMIKIILNEKIADEVWIIPSKIHPFGKKLENEKHRVKMIKIAIKNIKNARIYDIELKSKGVCYTADTIKLLKSKYNHKFYWVLGSDILKEMEKWKKFSELVKETNFIIFERKNYPIIKISKMKIHKIISEDKTTVSSTRIRKRVKEGKSLKEMVPLNIEKYIQKKRLYLK